MSVYADALTRLFGLVRVGEKYALDGPRMLESALGSPLESFSSILVGGTNGKGSTSACLSTLLNSSGKKVGLFTSPHLLTFRERIRINNEPISETETVALVDEVLPLAEAHGASFFEATWAMAAVAFRNAGVEYVVWEVGLGGRLDATNVCTPIGTIVTNVQLDHMGILGNTRAEIAREKAALFRPNRPALTGCSTSLQLLQRYSDATICLAQPDPTLRVALPGAHQVNNASVAVSLLRSLDIDFDSESLYHMNWPGRLERHGNFIVDCAHNPHALETALSNLSVGLEDEKSVEVIFGTMADKDITSMANILKTAGHKLHLVEPTYPRRMSIRKLQSHFAPSQVMSAGSVKACLSRSSPDTQYVVLGSSFLAAEVIAHLVGQPYPECGIVTTAR